jgi:3-dehydroquinate synthase
MGSSRPLDFGHWSAHKLETLSGFSIRHGEAVALGIALDSAYSYVSGRLSADDAKSIIALLKNVGLQTTHPLMEITSDDSAVLRGLNEFREHLGGKLTIMLLDAIGKGVEVHELDTKMLIKAGEWLRTSS